MNSLQSKTSKSMDTSVAIPARDDGAMDDVALLPALKKIWECEMIEWGTMLKGTSLGPASPLTASLLETTQQRPSIMFSRRRDKTSNSAWPPLLPYISEGMKIFTIIV